MLLAIERERGLVACSGTRRVPPVMQLDESDVLERAGLTDAVAGFPPERQGLLVEVRRTLDIPLRLGQGTGPVQRAGPYRGRNGFGAFCVESPFQVFPAFTEMAPDRPELPERA